MNVDGQIKNYFENLVTDEINNQMQWVELTQDQWIDVACVALNHLPARYYRYSVDMAFYLSGAEIEEMNSKVTLAVQNGIKRVKQAP